MSRFKRWAGFIVGQTTFTFALHLLLRRFPAALLENAVTGWVDDRIAELLGLLGRAIGVVAPTAQQVSTFIWNWALPFVLAAFALWVVHRAAKHQSPKKSAGQTQDRFFEVTGHPLQNEKWTSLFIVASEARRENVDTPYGHSLIGMSAHAQIVAYAGKINDAIQLHGTFGGPLLSEPINERGDKIKFRTNGMQMDSTDVNGRPFYRFVHLHTADAPTALAAVRKMAAEYEKNATTKMSLNGVAYEQQKDEDGAVLRDFAFFVQITNGDLNLTKCQLYIENPRMGFEYPISGLFDLRPGEKRLCPVIRYDDPREVSDCRAFIYHVRRDTGEIFLSCGKPLLGPDRYQIKMLATEVSPIILEVQLSRPAPRQWTLEEIRS
jgi:hypothetical protein